ncbi:MAG TPA: 2-oxoacid:acceptor oxidoreductase family protein [Gaiellaceae bacterium]|nr:2-oxoacid:acceptor oxidoreductase family protein [Gaiellaceae bacterium]
MIEVRWHARAGQGAKTAAQLLAEAMLRAGKYVQAFPEYGPERRGAPMRAYTRIDRQPIRRHDSVTHPDVVVVLDPSLVHESDVTDGMEEGGLVLVNATTVPPELSGANVRCVTAEASVNVAMAGAIAAALGEPSPNDVADAAVALLGKKADADALRAAAEEGFNA